MLYNGTDKIINLHNGETEIGQVYNGTVLVYESLPINYTRKINERAISQGMVLEGESCLYAKLKTLN